MADRTVTVDRLKVRRSFVPGYRPGDNGSRPLDEGEEFINFADRIRLIGDGVTPPGDLFPYPLLPSVSNIPGLIDLQDDVTEKAAQVATNTAAVATAAVATAADRVQTGQDRLATSADRAATAVLHDQVNSIASSQAPEYPLFTDLPASGSATTILAAYVTQDTTPSSFGTRTGRWTRASGTAPWVQQSADTVPGIAARTREVQPRTPGTVPLWMLTDDLLRSILRVTPQGDPAVPRLRVGRLPRWFGGALGGVFGPRWEQFQKITRRGETGASALRLARLSRAHGSGLGGIFGPRWERFLEVTRRGDTRVHRLLVARLSRAFGGGLGGIFGPRWERFLEFTRRGEARVQAVRLAVKRTPGTWSLSQIKAPDGRAFINFLPSGRTALNLDPASFVGARLAAQREPEDLIALLGKGQPTGQIKDFHVRGGSGQCVGFQSDIDGVFLPYVMRRDLSFVGPQPCLLMPGSTIEGQVSYGQSWRDQAALVDGMITGFEPRRCMMLARTFNGQLEQIPTVGIPFGVDRASTFWPMVPGSNVGIGAASMMALQRIRTLRKFHTRTIVDTNSSLGGTRWDGLRPGTQPWDIGIQQRAKAEQIGRKFGGLIDWLSVLFTHGAAMDGELDGAGNVIDYYAALNDMKSSFVALALYGSQPLRFYIDQTAPKSQQTVAQNAILSQLQFALDNSGSVFNIGPRNAFPFSDDIHHTPFANLLIGEKEAYVRHVTQDRGLPWPGCRPISITLSGATVTMQMSRAEGMGGLTIDTTSIEAAPQYGLHLHINGVDQTIESITAANDTIAFNLAVTPASGTACVVSNLMYGPGAPVGTHSGVWGNIKRTGPASVLVANRTTDDWAYAFRQTVIAA